VWNDSCRFKIQAILVLALLICGEARAADEFDGVKCGSDVSKALVGKRSSNQPVAALEGRHKDLGLKNLGGFEVSDRLSTESWLICRREFEVLVDTRSQVIRDVLPFPSHSKRSPSFIGECQVNGREMVGTVLAVLDNKAGYNARDSHLAKTLLKATAAWKIDEAQERFEALSIEGLGCPLEGIATLDGGP
jgi:hypothetical protein